MRLASTLLGLVLLSGCQGLRLQPLMGVNTRLSTPGDDRSPSMARQGVVWIAPGPAGQHQVRWFDLASGMGGWLARTTKDLGQGFGQGQATICLDHLSLLYR